MAVIQRKDGWGARVDEDGRQKWLGTFDSREKAEEACAEFRRARPPRSKRQRPQVDLRVYFIQHGDTGPIKIGSTAPGGVEERLKALQCGNPVELKLRAVIKAGHGDEAMLHRRFKEERIRGEWFEPTPRLLELIDGINTKGFMLAVGPRLMRRP